MSKLTFYSLTIIFHSLCLSGLIWQVTQISVNFFEFDVLTDIKIFTPEESEWSEKVAYVCFDDNELINREKFPEWKDSDYKTQTIGQRFKTRWTRDQIFSFQEFEFEHKYAFVVRHELCFQFQFEDRSPKLVFNRKIVSNVTFFFLSIGHESNNYTQDRKKPNAKFLFSLFCLSFWYLLD